MTWLWVLGFLIVFPVPVMLLLRKSRMNRNLKIVLMVASWIVYAAIVINGVRNSAQERNLETEHPVMEMQTEVSDEVQTEARMDTGSETSGTEKETVPETEAKESERHTEAEEVPAVAVEEDPVSDLPEEDDGIVIADVNTSAEHDYVLNTNTMKFHDPGCRHAKTISADNKAERFCTREELIVEGYEPCGVCNP